MPLTFQILEVFVVFCTVAVNCFVCRTRTVALVGEIVMLTGGGAVTSTNAVFDPSPSGVRTTTGTPDFTAGPLPAAVSSVEDDTVVAKSTPSKETMAPGTKPAPFTVSMKFPVVRGDGLSDVMLGWGRIVAVA